MNKIKNLKLIAETFQVILLCLLLFKAYRLADALETSINGGSIPILKKR